MAKGNGGTLPPLVYICNVGAHDYSAAERWTPLGRGGIRAVTSGDVDRKNTGRLVANVVHALKHFREEDYFVFSGSPIPWGVAMFYFGQRKDLNKINVLYYLKSADEYFAVTYTKDMFDSIEQTDFLPGGIDYEMSD